MSTDPLRDLLAAVEPLMDTDVVTPFMSAWEFEPWSNGEEMHENLRRAYEAAKGHIAGGSHFSSVTPGPPAT